MNASGETHIPTLERVKDRLISLKPHGKGRYLAGCEEGIREALRSVCEMLEDEIKKLITKVE